jgi:hypothetical protein
MAIGWLLGSVLAIQMWHQSDRLGGHIRVIDGPGKPSECVNLQNKR